MPVFKQKVIYLIVLWFCTKCYFTDLIFIIIKTLIQSYPKWIFKQNSQAAFIRHIISFPYTGVQMYRATLRGHDKEDAAAQKLLSRQEEYLHSWRHIHHLILQNQ